MKSLTATILSENDFKGMVRAYIRERATFDVHETRGKNLYLYDDRNKLIARGRKGRTTETKLPDLPVGSSIFGTGISFMQGMAVTTQVKNQVKDYLLKIKEPAAIEAKHSTTGRDHKAFKEIKDGEAFYSVDINHAYFQVLRKLGYITEEFYDLYKDQEQYKQAFIFACSWLESKAKVYSYRMGILMKVIDKSKSEKGLKVIYDNVRHTVQNLLGEIYEQIGSGAVAYLTDEIFIKKEALPFVKEYFRNAGYEFKINICRKISDTELNRANKKSLKLFGKGAEKAKGYEETKAPNPNASSDVEKESNARVRAMMRRKSSGG